MVFSENQGGQPAWLHSFKKDFQETPYKFTSVDELETDASCAPNRGNQSSGLFLVSHWLTPGTPTDAQTVNGRAVLGDRAARCEALRGHLPNLVAVDFASFGDLVAVTDSLNVVER